MDCTEQEIEEALSSTFGADWRSLSSAVSYRHIDIAGRAIVYGRKRHPGQLEQAGMFARIVEKFSSGGNDFWAEEPSALCAAAEQVMGGLLHILVGNFPKSHEPGEEETFHREFTDKAVQLLEEHFYGSPDAFDSALDDLMELCSDENMREGIRDQLMLRRNEGILTEFGYRQSPEEWEGVISAFLNKTSTSGSGDSSGLSVSVDNAGVVLEWHGAGHCANLPKMDLATWDGYVLTVPGPGTKMQSVANQWCLLTTHGVWEDEEPNMIAYLMKKLLENVRKADWSQRWNRVKEVVPWPCSPDYRANGAFLYWHLFIDDPKGFYHSKQEYPFQCDIAGEGGPLLKSPSPDRIVERLAERAAIDHPEANADPAIAQKEAGALAFLREMIRGWNMTIDDETERKIGVKVFQENLDRYLL